MYYIYKITNLINSKTYIGQHKYKKLNDRYMGSGVVLRQAFKKYSIENFKKEILYSNIQYKDTADDIERFAIAKERELGKAEYNIADGGQGGCGNHTEKTKDKISKSLKGRHLSEEHKKILSEVNKGKHLSKETREKMSKSKRAELNPQYGKDHSGENSPFYKKHHTEESKRKISESKKEQEPWNKGKKLSEEHKKNISKGRKGKPHSEETCRKLSETMKGRPHSEEHNRKVSEARKEMAEAYKKSGRKDWNTFQKEYRNSATLSCSTIIS